MNEIRIQLTPKQTDFDVMIDEVRNTFYGGAKGGGKSHGLRMIMLKRRIQYPGSYGAIFRKTYPELYNNHISPILTQFPFLRDYYSQQNKQINFPNGSRLAFRHCQYEKDLALHQGVEYDDLAIEEAGEWPEHWAMTLKGSNRTSRPGIKARLIMTGNPGGVGHKWLKRLFIDKKYNDHEKPEDYGFVPATVYDNPALIENDPDYINVLKQNKNPLLVKAYLEGSWDLQAGQFFEHMSRETHLVDPFPIPDHWQRFGAYDYGYNHPSVFGWFAVDEDGKVYLYREFVGSRRQIEDLVKTELMVNEDTYKLRTIEAGHDCWNKQGTGVSVEEKFREVSNNKIILDRANNDRIQGAMQVRDYLYPRENGPLFLLFKNCPVSFDTLVRMQHDPKRPEDVLKVDADAEDPTCGDDCYDMIRYGLMSRPRAAVPVQKEVRDKYARRSRTSRSWKTA